MRSIFVVLICLFLVILTLSGCQDNTTPKQVSQTENPAQSGQNSVAETEKKTEKDTVQPKEQAGGQAAGQPDTQIQKEATPVPERKQPVVTPEQESKYTAPAVPAKNFSLKTGEYLPVFTLSDLNGNKGVSSELFAGNKITVINLWSTYWGACIDEMPALEGLRKKYAGRGVEVVGIILDTNRADLAVSIMAKNGAGFPNLLDDGRFITKVYAIPQTYLVDSKGKILTGLTGSRTLQQFSQVVEKYL